MLFVLVLVAGLSVAQQFPRGVTPASASPDLFSAERALTHLPAIASEPHPAGSKAQEKVRNYIFQQLSALGLEVETQPFASGENVVARLRGGDSTGAIVILAHYDSTPAGPGASRITARARRRCWRSYAPWSPDPCRATISSPCLMTMRSRAGLARGPSSRNILG